MKIRLPILAQIGLEGTADLQVRDGVIEIHAIRRNPREGWADSLGQKVRSLSPMTPARRL